MKFMAESCIMVKDTVCDGGMKMLEGFKSPLSATAYEKCIDAGYEFLGLVTPFEYGIDNLFDAESTSDEVIEAVKSGKCDFALCRDVFGRIVRAAAENGLVFAEGAYGTVSRFGLMQAVSSTDRVGVLCRDADTAAKVLSVISGHDEKDGSMLYEKEYSYTADYEGEVKVVTAENAEMKYIKSLEAVYYCLASAEICNNTNRYDGVKFGHRAENINGVNDLYVKSRSEGFGKDMKIASIVGCMVLAQGNYEKWYYKAMQIRRLAAEYYTKMLTDADVLILPTECDLVDKFGQMRLYALAKLCGFASVTATYNGRLSQIIARRGNENAMFKVAKEGK